MGPPNKSLLEIPRLLGYREKGVSSLPPWLTFVSFSHGTTSPKTSNSISILWRPSASVSWAKSGSVLLENQSDPPLSERVDFLLSPRSQIPSPGFFGTYMEKSPLKPGACPKLPDLFGVTHMSAPGLGMGLRQFARHCMHRLATFTFSHRLERHFEEVTLVDHVARNPDQSGKHRNQTRAKQPSRTQMVMFHHD